MAIDPPATDTTFARYSIARSLNSRLDALV